MFQISTQIILYKALIFSKLINYFSVCHKISVKFASNSEEPNSAFKAMLLSFKISIVQFLFLYCKFISLKLKRSSSLARPVNKTSLLGSIQMILLSNCFESLEIFRVKFRLRRNKFQLIEFFPFSFFCGRSSLAYEVIKLKKTCSSFLSDSTYNKRGFLTQQLI